MKPENIAKVIALSEDGRSVRYIAAHLNFPRSTVQDAIKRYRETGQYERTVGSGRKRATNERDDRFMVSMVLRDRFQTARIVAGRLAQVRGVNISVSTASRKRSSKRSAHRINRLTFARNHVSWTTDDWKSVLFTDESRFSLRSPDGRERVWRRSGERYSQCAISPRVPFHGRSLMVWAGISIDARTDLVFLRGGTITAERYIVECLEEFVVPYAPFIGQQFKLMHDNARPHVANVVNNYLDEVGIDRIVWPARSPDLNPIEHMWDMLGRRLRQREVVPETLDHLQSALQEEWEMIPQEYVANLVHSMPKRMLDVIRARGGNTRY